MDRATLAASIDHTMLGPTTTAAAVRRTLDEAADHGMNACVPPCYVPDATEYAPSVTLVTVIGFPHGQNDSEAKATEAELAWEAGADELDAVINVGRLKSGDDEVVCRELESIVACVPIPVKVIIETALLDDAETRRACQAAEDAGADMVKTSTGFADGGATVADVELMSEYLPVKASGGISTYDEAMAMFDAGATRIGASSGVAILDGHPDG